MYIMSSNMIVSWYACLLSGFFYNAMNEGTFTILIRILPCSVEPGNGNLADLPQ